MFVPLCTLSSQTTIIDVDARRVEVHTAPRDGIYTTSEILAEDMALDVPGTTTSVPIADLLPQ